MQCSFFPANSKNLLFDDFKTIIVICKKKYNNSDSLLNSLIIWITQKKSCNFSQHKSSPTKLTKLHIELNKHPKDQIYQLLHTIHFCTTQMATYSMSAIWLQGNSIQHKSNR